MKNTSTTKRVVLASMLTLFALLFFTGFVAAESGTCIYGGDCFNSTGSLYNVNLGGSYDGTQAACLSLDSAAWNPNPNYNTVAACQSGCCCESDGSAGTSYLPGNTCDGFVAYQSNPAWVANSCTQTCAAAKPQTNNLCTSNSLVTTACVCGITTAQSGQYCCANGDVASAANQCSVIGPTIPACPYATSITSQSYPNGCTCNGQTITSGTCQAPITTTCGNNIREGKEQCDFGASTTRTLANGCLKADGTLDTNSYCTSECTCVTPSVPPAGGCNNNGICEGTEDGTTCSDCAAPAKCDLSNTQQGNAQNFQGVYDTTNPNQPEVSLTWNTPTTCTNFRTGYSILRSSSEDKLPGQADRVYGTNEGITKNSVSFNDKDIPVDTTVLYYQIATYYQDALSTQVTYTQPIQVAIKNSLCPQASISYCQDAHTTVNCNGYTPNTATCQPGDVCTVQSGQATCTTQSVQCDVCNGLFSSIPDDSQQICESGTDASCNRVSCDQSQTCYRDLSNTTVPDYQACSSIDSCIGYRTQSACEQNICSKPGNCEWSPTDPTGSNGLQTGVCRPSVEAFQDCSQCNELGSACTKNICQAISNNCYYNNPADDSIGNGNYYQGCFNKKDTMCEFFGTEAECVGSPAQPYIIDAQYATKDGAWTRVSGTNNVIQPSNDAGGLGKCVWDGKLCHKDADGSSNNGAYPQGFDQREITDASKRIEYLKDFTPGFSSIIGVPGSLFSDPVQIQFTNTSAFYATFCPANEPAANCYPGMNITGIIKNTISHSFVGSDITDWVLYYYTEDEAHNLEPVKSFPFKVDTTKPVITITKQENNILLASGTTYTTSVSIEFNVSENSTCTTTLNQEDNNAPLQTANNIQNAYGKSFGLEFVPLPGGVRYTFKISCADDAGNVGTYSETIVTDTDLRITNPQPYDIQNPLKTTAVNINITTEKDATCRYGPLGSLYTEMTPFTTTGGTLHQSTLTGLTQSQIYRYAVACMIDNTVVYGDPSDEIAFSIDRIGPTITACLSGGITTPDGSQCEPIPSTPAESFSVQLFCKDNPENTPNFGCDRSSIYFCTQPANQVVNCVPQRGFSTGELTGTQDTTIIAYATDNGGTQSPLTTITLKTADLTPPSAPQFTITP